MTAASPTQHDGPEKYGYNGSDVGVDNSTTVAPATTGMPGTTTTDEHGLAGNDGGAGRRVSGSYCVRFLQKLHVCSLTRLVHPVAPFGQTLRGEVVLRAPVGRSI